jgi:hypothetical protein
VTNGVAEQEDGGGTAAALKPRSRQKAMQAFAPMAKSAMPTSNWNGLTSHPMSFAAVAGKKT